MEDDEGTAKEFFDANEEAVLEGVVLFGVFFIVDGIFVHPSSSLVPVVGPSSFAVSSVSVPIRITLAKWVLSL